MDDCAENDTRRFAGCTVIFIASLYSHLAAFHIPFIELLQSWGCEVHAAASSAEGGREYVEATGAVCWEVPFRRSPYSWASLKAFCRLRSLLRDNRYDLVHVHTPVAAFIGRLASRLTGQGPVLYTAHGFHFYEGARLRNWLVYYTAERLAARWTDGLIVINEEDAQNARRLGFLPGQNLFPVHGVGVDFSRFALESSGRIRSQLGIEDDEVVVTCIAEMTANKNHTFLLDAWKSVAKRLDRLHLLLVGGGNAEPVQRRVDQESIPRVCFLGKRQDVPLILAETDIVVLVSMREGLPRCLMEAMAAGRPVVASNVRGNRDLVEHGSTGFLVDLGDVTALAESIERLALDAELRKAMGMAGREKIQEYGLERVLTEMSSLYAYYLTRDFSS